MKPIAFLTEPPEARTPEALAAGWAAVVATRDASPEGCPCRQVTGPLIAEWEKFYGDGREDFAGAVQWEGLDRQWANLAAAQAAQAAPALLPEEGGDFAIDVRTAEEVERDPKLDRRAVNVPLAELEDRLDEIPEKARIVVYCASGKRAARAVETLREWGFHACNGHEDSCPLPAAPMPAAAPKADPPMGGAGIFNDWWKLGSVKDGSLFNGGAQDQQVPEASAFPPARAPIALPAAMPYALVPEDAAPSRGNQASAGSSAASDPRMGAADAGGILADLGGLLGQAGQAAQGAATGAGQAAGDSAGKAAGQSFAAAVPAIADAVRAQVPATVGAVGQAAGPAVQPLAAQAGDAAGRAAVEGARKAADEQGMGAGAKVAIGAGVLVAGAAAVWFLTRKGSKK